MLDFGNHQHDVKDAIIYTRISSKAQEKKGAGLQSQEVYCRNYAQWKNYTIHKVFSDSGISGSRADRKGVIEMLSYLRKNRGKRFVCIVDDISRISRDIRVHLDLRDAINDCNAILESPAMTFGEDADGRYFENMQALSAQHHREKNAETTKKRMQSRAIDGFWPFPAPLGLKHERQSGKGKVLVPDEQLAPIIRTALENYANGILQSQAEVARYLENQPDFPKNRYGKVTIEAANRILTRVLYAGYIQGPHKWNIPLTKGQHEGLISLATYTRIQERLNGKPKIAVRSDVADEFPLRGFVLCGDCGNPLTACFSKSKTGARHPYYMCHKKGCPSKGKSIRRAKIEGEFQELLTTVTPTETLVELTRAMFTNAWEMLGEQEAARKRSGKLKLLEMDKQIESLLDQIVDAEGDGVIKAYEKRINKLEREKLVLSEKIQNTVKNRRSPEEMFELALNRKPCSSWSIKEQR
ncbi:MAG: recombinase family protein [Pseudomonadota bacterium]